MKKNPILESLSSRKFRFGGYATLLDRGAPSPWSSSVNVLVDQIPGKLDLTQEQDLLAVRRDVQAPGRA